MKKLLTEKIAKEYLNKYVCMVWTGTDEDHVSTYMHILDCDAPYVYGPWMNFYQSGVVVSHIKDSRGRARLYRFYIIREVTKDQFEVLAKLNS